MNNKPSHHTEPKQIEKVDEKYPTFSEDERKNWLATLQIGDFVDIFHPSGTQTKRYRCYFYLI